MARPKKQRGEVTRTTTREVETLEITLRVPVVPSDDRPSVRNPRVQSLSQSEQRALRALFDGLVYAGETVRTSLDRPVQHIASDPLRWLLQEIAKAI